MNQYIKSLLSCAFGLAIAYSYATAQDTSNSTDSNNEPEVSTSQAMALRDQYAASSELNKKIATLLAKASDMPQAQFEQEMGTLLADARQLSNQMKRYAAMEQQQQILARTITAAEDTLTGLQNGTQTQAQAIAALRRLRAPLHQNLVGIGSILRNNGYIDILQAYLNTLRNPDNSQISPEA